MKVNKLTVKNAGIPSILAAIPAPPKELYVMGELGPLMQMPRVAIVGSRKVSPYGRHVTQRLAESLARAGVVIVSGLALGVDAIAHKACLEAGGKTIAVLPTSLDSIYPSSHRHLAEAIVRQGGALVSEYAPGMPGLKKNFIERNRLVSGISDAVLITEAAIKSGTLHTANYALDQGKTVMAVPGNVTSPTSEGTNNLLKSGAIMVTEAADVLAALNLALIGSQRQLPIGSNREEQVLIDLLADGMTDSSELLQTSKLDASTFNQTLTMLEITGKIRATGAGHWQLKW